ncbi:MAG: solute carrier family 26 protein [Pyrinomonadaceae bacterium]
MTLKPAKVDVRVGAARVFPALNWMTAYKRDDLVGDMMAGLIVAIMLVPQSMAYAMLAGLPPEIGLYSSMAPLIIYALFGSSRTLAVGPVAMVSLLTLSGIAVVAEQGTARFVALALTLALMTGVIQLLMGLFRLGFLVNYLSHPVLVGFTSAAAIVIGLSQLKHVLGVSIPKSEATYSVAANLWQALPKANPWTMLIGFGAIAILFYFKWLVEKNLSKLRMSAGLANAISKSGPLVVVFAGTIAVWLWGLNGTSAVKVVGSIPAGLPGFTIPELSMADIGALFPVALIISLVGFTESISIATTLASRRRQKIDANQELIALGAANVGAAVTGGYPVTGGLSRSAVNFSSGANTGLASVITAVLIGITLLFFTPLFYYLPQAVLGSMVIVAVVGLFDFKSFLTIWKYDKTDGIALLATFFGVLLFNIEAGIGIGIGTALLFFLHRTSKPHVAVVGRVGDTEHYRNVRRHEVSTCEETFAVRIDESLYFANAKTLENSLLGAVADNPKIRNIVLICSAVNFIDASALEILERVIEDLGSAGVRLCLAEVKGPVSDRLDRIGFLRHFGEENIFMSTHQAMKALGCER